MALELLSPAGERDSLTAAVQNGADAVYLGGRAFSARRYAGNFDDAALREALDYCHIRGVKAYVAVNTLLLDRELNDALSYAAYLYEAGADALIVQDMGLVRALRCALPELTLHASTQMAIHDENGLNMVHALGLTRAVLARELSLERIRALSANSPVELECFSHGALCTSVSGVCLFSSLAGGRSGNRGACAQPCRKTYALNGGKQEYPLSLSDLSMLLHVDELKHAGVACIKLEGRMKRAEYVAAVTRAYRMAIDGAEKHILEEELESLQRIFSRGVSTGYFYGRDVPANARGILSGSDAPLAQEQETYRTERRKRPVEAHLTLRVGEPAGLTLTLGQHRVSATGETVQQAKTEPDASRYIAQMGKLGDTPFTLVRATVDMPMPAYIPVSALNALRRNAVEEMEAALALQREKPEVSLPAILQRQQSSTPAVLAVVPDAARAVAAFSAGADYVALEARDILLSEEELFKLQPLRAGGQKLLLQLPAADISGHAQKYWDEVFSGGLVDGGIAQNAGQVALIKGERFAGYLCNATNAQAVTKLMELGFTRVLLSLELSKPQLRDLVLETGAGIYGYGRAQLMQLWHCPHRRENGCAGCDRAHTLTDAEGRVFPLDPVREGTGGCLNRVRNCEVMDILDVLSELPTPELVALEFVYETEREVKERVSAAQDALAGKSPPRRGTTRGHWARGLAT